MAATFDNLTLTDRQQECVDYKGKDLLIRGIPGSGKTVVLLKRARKLAQEGRNTKVRIFTFNKTLAKYARDLVVAMKIPNIEVVSFHAWALNALKLAGRRPWVIQAKDRSELIAKAVAEEKRGGIKAKVLDRDLEFFEDEITWIKGKMLPDVAAYEKADRKGRGAALRAADRRVVWDVYRRYQSKLASAKKMDWDDFAPELIKAASALPAEVRCDHILVDEAQDLQEAQLRLLRQVAASNMTIAADEAQKIYKTSFTWADLGINIRGQGSKRLSTSFRSTNQIVALAASLRQHDPLIKSGVVDAVDYDIPDIQGTTPVFYQAPSALKEEEGVLNLVRSLLRPMENGVAPTVGILARNWKLLYRLCNLLEEHEIPFEMIKEAEGQVSTPGVKLTTFHSAKGLEFDHVILVRLNEGVVPPAVPDETSLEDQEEFLAIERRLLFVSMTRAKFTLYMTCSDKPSRFIEEMDEKRFVRQSL